MERPSIIHYVVDDALKNGGIESNWNIITGDFMLVIIAGRLVSHATSSHSIVRFLN